MSGDQNHAGSRQEFDLPVTLGRPARRALITAGYRRLKELAGTSEAELLRLHGVGPKAIRLLRRELAEHSLSLRGE